jgi:TrmH family RNA methyltransferase
LTLVDCEIVLVRPSRPGNVAAACRAMKNMGFHTLRVVDPPARLGAPEARALAYGAWDILDGAVRDGSLREAVAGSTLVVATTARPGVGDWSPRRLAAEVSARSGGGRVSVVFGPEASGLTTDEISLCHERVRIPTAPEHPSLNLAQAVLLIAYEISLAWEPSVAPAVEARATSGELEASLDDLRSALLAIGFLNPDKPDAVLSELRRLIARSGPSPREVTLLRGLARQIGWAGEIVRGTKRDRQGR